jgi:hypothetical protein
MRGVFSSLQDQHFGHLLVQSRAPSNPGGGARCSCVCGRTCIVSAKHLRSGSTTSCGCARGVAISRRLTVHGESNTRTRRASLEYQTWAGIIQRCEDPTSISYKYYGALGITVCARWRASFEVFLADVGRRPAPRHTLDRFPNRDGNYEPGNVRWATMKQQQRNKSSNHMVVFRGESLCLSELAERFGLLPGTLYARLTRGWTVEAATAPVVIRGIQYTGRSKEGKQVV